MKTQTFITKIKDLLLADALFKMTFSKPRTQYKDSINKYLRPTLIKEEIKYSIVTRTKTQETIQHYTKDEIIPIIEKIINTEFLIAYIFTKKEEIELLQSKKGTSTYTVRPNKNQINFELEHDHQKTRLLNDTRPYYFALGLANSEGRILDKAQDKYRQIQKFIEIVDHILEDWPERKSITIADMGSGKGYLTFALYDHLTHNRKLQCRITGYEIREDLVATCYSTAIECGYMGLSFEMKSIDQVNLSQADMVIALHACDIATDMAIAQGVKANAQHIILSPCCHKQIRKEMSRQTPLSSILKHGILEERQAEIITDGIRALLLESKGYSSKVFEFIDAEHTGKNLMITATKGQVNPKAIEEVASIKQMFGIGKHYLEEII
jgi:Methyltransferase domain